MKLRPVYILALYISAIFLFAACYYYLPQTIFKENELRSFFTAVYFSIITITTLGYGDISPIGFWGKLLASAEVVFGVIIIGVFLSSLWHSFVFSLEQKQAQKIVLGIEERNASNLRSLSMMLLPELKQFRVVLAQITKPAAKRSKAPNLDVDFPFIALKDIWLVSALPGNIVTKPIIDMYYSSQDSLFSEIKFVLANIDFSDFSELRNKLIELIAVSKESDVRESLVFYRDEKIGDMSFIEIYKEQVSTVEGIPELNENSGLATVLFYLLKNQIAITDSIMSEISDVLKPDVVENIAVT